MTPAAGPVPTTAERIRSVCVRASALLAVDGADPVAAPLCQLLADGSIAIVAAAGHATPATDSGVPALLELTDHAPLPLRERVRALVWVRGRLRPVPLSEVADLLDRIAVDDPNPVLLQVRSARSGPADDSEAQYTLLRLTMESVVVADTTGAESVPVGELLAAQPDPFCSIEANWLRHLNATHPEVVARLTARLPLRLQHAPVHPLAIDRYGIWLRVEGADGDHDVRLAFHRQVDDLVGLNQAVRVLMGCPFRNGLYARRP
ncbi:MAG TPA: DUF2470 domain-containing protein [Mycobacterium sp.]|nr:DUF2470 domain-containing protein [Mycobacterium sp.]